MTGYKNFLTQKEQQIMSSLLNVSNDSSKPEEFSLKDIEVLADNKEQNWFKRAHIGRYLGIARTTTSTSKLPKEDKRPRAFLQAEGGIPSMYPLAGKDNIVMIIEKNTTPEEDEFYECPYYIARIQRQFINTKNDSLKHDTFIIDL